MRALIIPIARDLSAKFLRSLSVSFIGSARTNQPRTTTDYDDHEPRRRPRRTTVNGQPIIVFQKDSQKNRIPAHAQTNARLFFCFARVTHKILTIFAGINNLQPFAGCFPEATGFSNVTCFLQVHEISFTLNRTQIQLVNHPSSRASILSNLQDAHDNVLASPSHTFTKHDIRRCSFYCLCLHDHTSL